MVNFYLSLLKKGAFLVLLLGSFSAFAQQGIQQNFVHQGGPKPRPGLVPAGFDTLVFPTSPPRFGSVALGDLDNDGDLDFISGTNRGIFLYYKNIGTTLSPLWQRNKGDIPTLDTIKLGANQNLNEVRPHLVDIDNDGDLDFMVGSRWNYAGTHKLRDFYYFENTGSKSNPVFTYRHSEFPSLNAQNLSEFAGFAIGDIDDDGDLDIFSSGSDSIIYFENIGTKSSGSFKRHNYGSGVASKPSSNKNPFHRTQLLASDLLAPTPKLRDFDKDGDLDFWYGSEDGYVKVFENIGTKKVPDFGNSIEADSTHTALDTADFGAFIPIDFGDVNGDGIEDLISGNWNPVTFVWYAGTPPPLSPCATSNRFRSFSEWDLTPSGIGNTAVSDSNWLGGDYFIVKVDSGVTYFITTQNTKVDTVTYGFYDKPNKTGARWAHPGHNTINFDPQMTLYRDTGNNSGTYAGSGIKGPVVAYNNDSFGLLPAITYKASFTGDLAISMSPYFPTESDFGCGSFVVDSGTIQVTIVPDMATLTTSKTDITCYGDNNGSASIAISGAPSYNVLWSNNATTDTIKNLQKGTYTVRVITANNDTLRDTIHITEPDLVTAMINQGANAYLCPGDSVELTTNAQSGINYTWQKAATEAFTYVGGAGISDDTYSYFDFAFANDGTPYVAYGDGSVSSKLTVKKFDGSQWVLVGSKGFTSSSVSHVSLEINSQGVPYVAFADGSNNNNPTVVAFDGTNWNTIGNSAIANYSANYINLRISDNDEIYVAFYNALLTSRFTNIYTFKNSSWSTINSTPITTNEILGLNLVLAGDSMYCSVVDKTNNNKSIVKSYNGTKWITLGNNHVAPYKTYGYDLEVDKNGKVYYAFSGLKGSSLQGILLNYDYNQSKWDTLDVSSIDYFNGSFDMMFSNSNSLYMMFADPNVSSKGTLYELVNGTWNLIGSKGATPARIIVPMMHQTLNGELFMGFGDFNTSPRKLSMLKLIGAGTSTTANSTYVKDAGTYILTAQNANGCTASDTIVVSEPSNVTLTITANQNNLCNGDAFSSAWVKVCGGTAPYTYAWSNSATNDTITNLPAGQYIVTVTDANSNTAKDTIVITEPDAVIANIEEGAFAYMCPGDSVELSHKQQTGINYNWYQVGSDSSVWEAVGSLGFSQGKIREIKHAFNPSNNVPYVAFTNDDNYVTSTVMRFVNNQWELVGAAAFDTSVWYMDLEVASDGTPYLAYMDGMNRDKATVVKFDGSKWTTVGQRAFTIDGVYYFGLEITSKDSLFIGFSDGDQSGKGSVMKWDGNQWKYVGSPGFTDGFTSEISLAISPNDSLYFACRDQGNNSYATAYKFNGSAWVGLPKNTWIGDGGYSVSLDIDQNETVYMAYYECDDYRTVVEKLVNGKWELLGNQKVSADEVNYVSFELQYDSIPTVAYTDYDVNGKASVAQFKNGKWQYLGSQGFTADESKELDLEFDNNGIPFLSYKDNANQKANVVQFAPYSPLIGTGTSVYAKEFAQVQVIATNSNGCEARDTITIREPLDLYLSINADQANVCNGQFKGSAWVKVCGGTAPYTYKWSNNATNDTTAGLRAGTYTVTVTDANSNTATDTVVITEPTAITATAIIDSMASSDVSLDAAFRIIPSGGTPGYSFTWRHSSLDTNQFVGVGKDTFHYTITDANGCNYYDSVIIKDRYSVAITVDSNVSCNGLSNGGATASIVGGQKPISYQWLHGDTTKTIAGVKAGTYYFRVVDAKNDTLLDSVTITQPDALVASALVDSNARCFGSANGGITASTVGGTMPYNYNWSNSATTASITGLSANTYTVTITDANGCSDKASATITQPDSVKLNITYIKNISCFGANDGELGYYMTGGTEPYYSTSNTIFPSTDTVYHLQPINNLKTNIFDANGCFDSSTVITITQPAKLVASVVVDSNVTCFGGNNGGLTSSATGGTSPYKYNWNNNVTTATNPGVVAGNYEVIITDDNGCKDTANNSVIQPTLLVAGMIDGDTTVCSGTAPALLRQTAATSGGVGNYTYQWQVSTDSLNWNNISGATNMSYQPGAIQGNNWFRRLDSDGNSCGPDTTNVLKVGVFAQPNAGFTATTACEGKQTFFTDTTELAFGKITSYAWSFGDQGTSNQQNPINVYKNSGSYTVSLEIVADGGCKSSVIKTVSVNPVPSVTFTTTAECEGTATDFTNNSSISTGTLSYSWDLGDRNTSTATEPNHTYVNAGYYNVVLKATSDKGCIDSVSGTVQVKRVAQPNFSATSVCEGLNTTFTNLSTNASSYSWDFGNSMGASTKENPTYKYASSGNYTAILTATSADGCSDTAHKQVSVYGLPTAGFSATEVCLTKTTDFTNSSSGASSYQWVFGNGTSSNKFEPSLIYGKSGSYTVELTATTANGCTDVTTGTVTVNALPSVSFSTADICLSEDLTIVNNTTNASSFAWTFGDGNGSSAMSPTHTYAVNGKYSVRLIATSADGCVDSAKTTINAFAVPKVAYTAGNECFGTDIKFNNNSKIAAGSMTYNWTLGDGNTSGNPSPSYAYAATGTYDVKLVATSNNGCKDSASSQVTVYTQPVVNFATADVCQADAIVTTNNSTGGGSYTWTFGDGNSSSASAPTHNYSAPGKYWVKLEALTSNGCYDADSTEVNAFAEPQVAYTATNVCFGNNVDFKNNSKITVGSMTYNWTLGDGNTSGNPSPSYAYATTGTYNVKLVATSNNGCKDSASSQVTVYTQPVVNFATADVCQADAIVTTNNSTGGGSYTWTFGDGSGSSASAPTHNYSAPGKYWVKLEALTSNGCYDADSTEVNAFAEPQVAYTAANVCDGNDVVFNNNSKIAAGTMTYVWDLGNGASTGNPAPSYQYASNGTYAVKLVATSNNGCKDSVTRNVTVYTMPVVDFAAPNVCFGETLTTTNNTTGAASYAWNFGDGATSTLTSPTNFYAKSGNYNVRLIATTSNNCVDSLSKMVSIYAKPIARFDAKDVCDETAVSFANNSYNANITAHNWSFGDGNTSAVINPSYTYASNGSYDVTLITISDNNCSDTLTKTIVVHPNPVVAFANTTECDYDSTEFTNNTTIASGTISYEWNFGTGDVSTAEHPSYMFPQAGVYVVGLVATSDMGCVRSTSATVVVNPSPVAGISLANNCEEQISTFASTSTLSKGKISNYEWDMGDGATSALMNPTHLYALDGTYDISLIVTSDKACTDTALSSITIYNKPTADFSTPDVCFGKLSVFTDASIDAQDYTYDFGDKWGISILSEPEYTYEEPGTYNPTLYVTSEFGCRDTVTKTVVIYELPVAQFSVNNHCFGEDFTPTDNSLGTVTAWNWDYDNGDTETGIDPIYTYGKDGDYNVRLIVTDNNGCVDSLRKMVTVWPLPEVWVRADTMVSKGYEVPLEARGGVAYKWSPVDNLDRPLTATPIATVIEDITYTVTVANQFGCTKDTFVNLRVEEDYTLEPSNIMTPDGNGQNDEWIVEKAQYYNDVEVIVFDRWGRIVYQNANYDNTWKGVSQATGEALPDGAYYYIVKVPADREEYKGSITIFR
jgi:gliding motility-associated-like protein